MSLVRATAIGISVTVLLAAGGAWTDASASRLGWSTPGAPAVSDKGLQNGDYILQLDASTGVLGQGAGSVSTQSFSQPEGSAVNEAGPSMHMLASRRVTTDAYVETAGVSGAASLGFGGSIFGYTSVASSSRRFSADGYVETAGVAGATSSDLVGSIFGYTSVLKFNNAGLYSAAYTMTGPPPAAPAQDIPLPSALTLLATALGVVSGVHAIRRRRVGSSA